jgi:hypothetical protein
MVAIAISTAALVLSIAVFIRNRQQDKRNLLIKMHELLTSDRYQRGRALLFEKVVTETSIEQLSPEEYRDINAALSGFSLLGLYLKNGYVSNRDVMEAWAISIVRTCKAAGPLLAHRESGEGLNPHVGLPPLAEKAQEYLTGKGIELEYKVWRRTG